MQVCKLLAFDDYNDILIMHVVVVVIVGNKCTINFEFLVVCVLGISQKKKVCVLGCIYAEVICVFVRDIDCVCLYFG